MSRAVDAGAVLVLVTGVGYLGWHVVKAAPEMTGPVVVLAVLALLAWGLDVLFKVGDALDQQAAARQDDGWKAFFGGADLLADPEFEEFRRRR